MTEYVPVWLDPSDVKAQLGITDAADDALVGRCSAAVEPTVERARTDLWVYPEAVPVGSQPVGAVYTPDAEVYQAAVMLAARLVRRRNSPGGVESFAMSVTYVSRFDPDIARALHSGTWAVPAVG